MHVAKRSIEWAKKPGKGHSAGVGVAFGFLFGPAYDSLTSRIRGESMALKDKSGLSDDWVLAIGMFSLSGSILVGRFTAFEWAGSWFPRSRRVC